jgi:hypothetical protein
LGQKFQRTAGEEGEGEMAKVWVYRWAGGGGVLTLEGTDIESESDEQFVALVDHNVELDSRHKLLEDGIAAAVAAERERCASYLEAAGSSPVLAYTNNVLLRSSADALRRGCHLPDGAKGESTT